MRNSGPPEPWAPIIVTTFHPTSEGPAYINNLLEATV